MADDQQLLYPLPDRATFLQLCEKELEELAVRHEFAPSPSLDKAGLQTFLKDCLDLEEYWQELKDEARCKQEAEKRQQDFEREEAQRQERAEKRQQDIDSQERLAKEYWVKRELEAKETAKAQEHALRIEQAKYMEKLAGEFPEVFTACVVTRAQAKTSGPTPRKEKPVALEGLANTFMAHLAPGNPSLDRDTLVEAQAADPDLVPLFSRVVGPGRKEGPGEFYLEDGVLMRSWRPLEEPAEEWAVCHQVVLPHEYRQQVLKMGHAGPVAGHLDVARTIQRIQRHFWWPGFQKDVSRYCRSCAPCQLAGKAQHMPPPAPPQPLPVIATPVTHVMIDCVGPLPKTEKGNGVSCCRRTRGAMPPPHERAVPLPHEKGCAAAAREGLCRRRTRRAVPPHEKSCAAAAREELCRRRTR